MEFPYSSPSMNAHTILMVLMVITIVALVISLVLCQKSRKMEPLCLCKGMKTKYSVPSGVEKKLTKQGVGVM
jgi:preprotein translocase subunit SecG